MTKKELENKASLIPSMNWIETRDILRSLASKVRTGQSIVEVGTWLGACTAYMMLGIIDSGNNVDLHVYDRFRTYQSQIPKAAAFGVELKDDKSYFDYYNEQLKPFNVKYTAHKGDIKKAEYDGERSIGLFVDDASKKKDAFLHTMKTFMPFFMPNQTVVCLLDYFYYEKKPGKGYECQKEYMHKNKKHFKFQFRMKNSSEAFFLYLG